MTSLAEWNTVPARAGRPVSVLDRIIAILDAVKESGGSITITELAAQDRDAEVHRVTTRRGADGAALPGTHGGRGDARAAPLRTRRAREPASPTPRRCGAGDQESAGCHG